VHFVGLFFVFKFYAIFKTKKIVSKYCVHFNAWVSPTPLENLTFFSSLYQIILTAQNCPSYPFGTPSTVLHP